MSTTIVYATTTRAILLINPQRDAANNPILPLNVECAVAEISSTEAAKFATPGSYALDADLRTVIVTPPGPLSAAEVEMTAATSDLHTQYQAAMTRLDQIIAASSPTNAQVVAAIQDLATILKRTLRLSYDRLT